jgi:succinate-acetate transporter protein
MFKSIKNQLIYLFLFFTLFNTDNIKIFVFAFLVSSLELIYNFYLAFTIATAIKTGESENKVTEQVHKRVNRGLFIWAIFGLGLLLCVLYRKQDLWMVLFRH